MNGMKRYAKLSLLVLPLLLIACSSVGSAARSERPMQSETVPDKTPGITTDQEERVSDIIVQFAAGSTVVEAVMEPESPVARDFLSMLPMTVRFEDFHGMESIAYPPRDIDTTGGQGMAPQVGDLFVYVPWGNFGFFSDTGSLGFSDDLVRIGTTEDIEEITALQGHDVTISVR